MYETDYIDYERWADHLDVVAISFYPNALPNFNMAESAMWLDALRGYKHGKPFFVKEFRKHWYITEKEKA